MKLVFENWRQFINEQRGLDLPPLPIKVAQPEKPLKNILRGPQIIHKTLGELPPEKPTEDHYVQAIVDVAKCINHPQVKERYINSAKGLIPILDDFGGIKEWKKPDVGLANMLQHQAKKSVELTYFIRGLFKPCDIAKILETRYDKEKRDEEKRESKALADQGISFLKPSEKDFLDADFEKFRGNGVIQVKENSKRQGRLFAQPTMINFLNSFTRNRKIQEYGPWFAEDISLQAGGDISGHGSHEWGLDVDLSIPSLAHRGGQALKTGKQKDKGEWNFDKIKPEELNLDGCIELIKHCFNGKYEDDWQVKYIFLDESLISVIKQEIKARTVPSDYNEKYDRELDILSRKGSLLFLDLFKLGRIKHEPNHKNHFHIRLYMKDRSKAMIAFKKRYQNPNKRYRIVKGKKVDMLQKSKAQYLATGKSWEKLIDELQDVHKENFGGF